MDHDSTSQREPGEPRERPPDKETDSLLDAVYEFNTQGRLVYANAAARALFGFEPDEDVSQLRIEQTIIEEDRAISRRDLERIYSGEPVRGERTFVRRDGERFCGEVHAGPVLLEGKVVGVRGVLRDITERRRAEERLRESELRFKTLFELSPQPTVVTELETGCLIDVNRKLCELSGFSREEAVGRRTWELGLLTREDRERLAACLAATGEVRGMPVRVADKNGTTQDTLMYAKVIPLGGRRAVVSVVADLSEYQRLEARLLQAQKMEAVGTLAGGVAHDFNNMLTVVGGLASLGLRALEPQHPAAELLQQIQEQVRSAASLTRQLLAYARTGKYEAQATELNAIVRRTAEMFARTRREVSLQLECAPEPCCARVDRSQLEHALLNLYVNAVQAMDEGGILRVGTCHVALDQAAAGQRGIPAGRYVRITVADSGVGMDEATRSRIFEPFFTTKEMGRGTGLGLASVYGIVKNHGGAIDVWSEPGEGSSFDIHLPASDAPGAVEDDTRPQQPKGCGRVLLVDDEEGVVTVGAAMLGELGYEVLVARGGKEALELVRSHPGAIDLVMLDMVMPGMSGAAVFQELRSLRPEVAVLLVSGYSLEGAASRILSQGCTGFLQKPFGFEELSQRVASLIASSRTDQGG